MYIHISVLSFVLYPVMCKDDRAMCLIYECPEFLRLILTHFLKCIALAISEIIAIGILVVGCKP